MAYVWVNGELIAEGISIPNFQSGTNWVYTKLYFDQATTECTAYIDTIKIFETETLDTHAEDEFNIALEDEITDDYITVDGSEIKTPSRATIADVKEAFPGIKFKFEKDGALPLHHRNQLL